MDAAGSSGCVAAGTSYRPTCLTLAPPTPPARRRLCAAPPWPARTPPAPRCRWCTRPRGWWITSGSTSEGGVRVGGGRRRLGGTAERGGWQSPDAGMRRQQGWAHTPRPPHPPLPHAPAPVRRPACQAPPRHGAGGLVCDCKGAQAPAGEAAGGAWGTVGRGADGEVVQAQPGCPAGARAGPSPHHPRAYRTRTRTHPTRARPSLLQVSGLGDALATYFEARAVREAHRENDLRGASSFTGMALGAQPACLQAVPARRLRWLCPAAPRR